MQDVVVGEGADHRGWDQVHQELRGGVHMLAAFGEIAHVCRRQLLEMDIRAAADAGAEGEDQADHQSDGGQHFKVDH
ncbi:hypothetical protein D3C72_2305600 [compost metagenome]